MRGPWSGASGGLHARAPVTSLADKPPHAQAVSRPLAAVCAALVAGIGLGLHWPDTAPVAGALAVAGIVLALAGRGQGWLGRLGAVLIALALGLLRGGAAERSWWRQPLLPWAGRTAEVEGIVDSPPVAMTRSERIDVRVEQIGRPEADRRPARGLLRLRVEGPAFVRVGDRIRFTAELQPPRTAGNPGGYSERRYLQAAGVALTADLKAPPQVLQRAAGAAFGRLAERWRRRLVDGLAATMPGPAPRLQGQILASLAFGRYAAPVPEPIEEAFRRAGLVHLLVASGSQVSLLLGIAFLLSRRAPHGVALVAGVLLLAAYLVVTGFEPSILRAALMGAFVLGALLTGRDYDAGTALAGSAALILLAAPQQFRDVGFQLSFAATAGLVFLGVPLYRRVEPQIGRACAGLASFTLGAQLAVAPVLLWQFRALSIVGLPANLLALPLAGVLVLLGLVGSLLAVVWPAAALIVNKVSGALLTNTLAAVGSFAAVPGAYRELWAVTPGQMAGWLALLGALALALEPPRWRSWWTRERLTLAGLVVAAALVGWRTWSRARAELQVSILDVGQGDSILISTPGGGAWLIDAGPRLEREGLVADAGAERVVPALALMGVRRLNGAIVTHADNDHLGGMPAVLEAFRVDRLYLPRLPRDEPGVVRLLEAAARRDVPISLVERGTRLELGGGVTCSVLWPPPVLPVEIEPGSNNASVVTKVVYRRTSFLLTADLEAEADAMLLRLPGDLRATVLKVPHQGSADALSDALLAAVEPALAVIPVGPNAFGHPAPSTLAKLAARGCRVHRTDRDGMVTYRSDGRQVTVRTFGRR